MPDLRTIAARFARALDADDFEAAGALLAPHCCYHTGTGTLRGPRAIVASYRQASEKARREFDRVAYRSQVEAVTDHSVTVLFIDELWLGDRSHAHRCTQRLEVDEGGAIARITHQEIPGERERLQAFRR